MSTLRERIAKIIAEEVAERGVDLALTRVYNAAYTCPCDEHGTYPIARTEPHFRDCPLYRPSVAELFQAIEAREELLMERLSAYYHGQMCAFMGGKIEQRTPVADKHPDAWELGYKDGKLKMGTDECYELVADGLSHSEAAGTVWPSVVCKHGASVESGCVHCREEYGQWQSATVNETPTQTEAWGDLLKMAGMIVAFSGRDPTGEIARACYDAADEAFALKQERDEARAAVERAARWKRVAKDMRAWALVNRESIDTLMRERDEARGALALRISRDGGAVRYGLE